MSLFNEEENKIDTKNDKKQKTYTEKELTQREDTYGERTYTKIQTQKIRFFDRPSCILIILIIEKF